MLDNHLELIPGKDALVLLISASLHACNICLSVEPSEISAFHVSMSTGGELLQVLLRQPYRWDIMGEASLSFLGSTTSEQIT